MFFRLFFEFYALRRIPRSQGIFASHADIRDFVGYLKMVFLCKNHSAFIMAFK